LKRSKPVDWIRRLRTRTLNVEIAEITFDDVSFEDYCVYKLYWGTNHLSDGDVYKLFKKYPRCSLFRPRTELSIDEQWYITEREAVERLTQKIMENFNGTSKMQKT